MVFYQILKAVYLIGLILLFSFTDSIVLPILCAIGFVVTMVAEIKFYENKYKSLIK